MNHWNYSIKELNAMILREPHRRGLRPRAKPTSPGALVRKM